MNFNIFTRIYILAIFIFVFTHEIQCFSFIFLLFSYLFIYLFMYLFRAANFMHNINIIHWSFFPTALPHWLPFLFLALHFLALPVSLPCLIPCPAYFLDLPMPTSLCLCLLPMPISSAFCLFPCPAYFQPVSLPCLFLITFACPACFLALPNSLPCLLPWPAHAYFLLPMLSPMPISSACFLALPTSVPCLFPFPAFFLTLPSSVP